MRAAEWMHAMRLPPGTWTIVRVDGRSFSRLTEELNLDKPFDEFFGSAMNDVASSLLREFNAIFAYTESDEISLVLTPGFDMFDRSVEKLVSVSAGVASAALTECMLTIGYEARPLPHFDSRVWLGSSIEDVVDYMSWRQADAARCALNGLVYWTLRDSGMTARAATAEMRGKGREWKHETLHAFNVNFARLPDWQRRGVGVWWIDLPHTGWNPKTEEPVETTRRVIYVADQLPMGDEFRQLVKKVLS
jgi:tRNA(His) 5'-end guanylyltransferase